MSVLSAISRPYIVYLAGIPLSFAYNTYDDAKSAIYEFRNNKLNDYDKKKFNNEESYIKYRMFQEFPPNLIMAPLWPMIFPVFFIPKIVRYMNPCEK